jgi:hypothetical protein
VNPQPDQDKPDGNYGSAAFGEQNSSPNQLPVSNIPAPSQNSAISTLPKKRHSKKLIAAVLAVLLVGLMASAYAYVQILNNAPEKVLADALSNTMTDVLDRKPTSVTGTFKYASKSDGFPYTVTIGLEAQSTGENGQLTATIKLDAGEEFDVSVTGTVIGEGSEAVYVKFDNLQQTVDDIVKGSPGLAAYADATKPLINKIEDKWIKIDNKSLAEAGWIQSEESVDKCSEAVGALRISKDDQKRVKEIFLSNQFAITSEELLGEEIDGDDSFHYKLDLNEEAGLRFAKDFMELQSVKGVKEACEWKQEDIDKDLEELKKQLDEEIQAKPVIELWVSKETRRPTKIMVTLDDKEFSMENIATIKIDAPNISIEVPKESMPLNEVITEAEKAFEKALGNSQSLGWTDVQSDIVDEL